MELEKSTVFCARDLSAPQSTTHDVSLWVDFAEQEKLSPEQVAQFQHYMTMLLEWNQRKNLTAITQPHAVISLHFQDSLRLSRLMDLRSMRCVADVGSGGGFPGIPLKIVYPHLKVILIEVNQKKRDFLHAVIAALGLTDITVSAADWRTFLHQKGNSVDVFCARASLQVAELLRVFKAGSLHQKARLVYYASRHWEASPEERLYIQKQDTYMLEDRVRNIILFCDPRR